MDVIELNETLSQQAAAKKKLIFGIVFSAIAFFKLCLGYATVLSIPMVSLILFLLSFVFFGVGVPFLVIGIVNLIKAKRKIALAEQENNMPFEEYIYEPTVEAEEPINIEQNIITEEPTVVEEIIVEETVVEDIVEQAVVEENVVQETEDNATEETPIIEEIIEEPVADEVVTEYAEEQAVVEEVLDEKLEEDVINEQAEAEQPIIETNVIEQQAEDLPNQCVCGQRFKGNFCPKCGAKAVIEPPVEETKKALNQCVCGTMFEGNFCPKCGTKAGSKPDTQPQTDTKTRCACGTVFEGNFCPKCGTKAGTYKSQQKANNSNFVELDWKKYNPLVAGVSYRADKNYGFHRADGFVGSVPQKFVDRTFPRCPMCCSNDPHWTIAQHNQMSWKGNLYLFKCSHCQSIISMSMPDVTTLGNGASGIVRNPTVGLTNLMVKSSSGKKVDAVYAVVESVGNSGVSRECEGKEFTLDNLQDMFLRR